MSKNNEIIVFSYGDANQVSTWSNIPFFFTRELERKDYVVRKVNIKKCELIQKIFNRAVKLFSKDTAIEFSFTPLGARVAKRAMKKAVKMYPNADLLIALNFSYSPAIISEKTNILLSDWTFEYLIRHFKNRKPTKWEQKEIDRQDEEIRNSDYVISLFPSIKDDMIDYYKTDNIYYLGGHINCDSKEAEDIDLDKKYDSKHILFIGQEKYRDNALEIIDAIKEADKELQLDIIGMKESAFSSLPEFVNCYGYLDKTIDSDYKKFYELIRNAKICINTSKNWGGYSSIVEAMYLYTPIITSPYEDFIKTFGSEIDFGSYGEDKLSDSILEIIDLGKDDYKNMCQNAHKAAADNTWSNYIDKMMKLISS